MASSGDVGGASGRPGDDVGIDNGKLDVVARTVGGWVVVGTLSVGDIDEDAMLVICVTVLVFDVGSVSKNPVDVESRSGVT